MLESFIQEHINKAVSYDKVPAQAGQSVQLIALWCHHIGLPLQWANPADWWDDADINFVAHWDKVIYDPTDPELRPKPGDIVIFSSALPGCGGAGHGSVFMGSLNSDIWEGFDASWSGRSAHVQPHNWAYVLGWFSPKNPSVVEQPIPTPLADEAPSDGFEAVIQEAKIITLKDGGAPLYNLNNVTAGSFENDPVSYGEPGEEITITAIAQHRLGSTFLMPDINIPHGYKISDCEYEMAVIDVVLSEGTAKPRRQLPSKPLTAPATHDIVPVKWEIPCYNSITDALERKNPVNTLQPNRYYAYKRLKGMISVTNEPGRSMSCWINPADLEEESRPEPKEWRTTFEAFRDKFGNVEPRWFSGRVDSVVTDLAGSRKDLPIQENQPILIAGWFEGPDGEIYGRPDDAMQLFLWYGVNRSHLKKYTPPEAKEEIRDEPVFAEDPANEIATIETIGGPVVMDLEPTNRKRDKLVTILPGLSKVFDIVKTK